MSVITLFKWPGYLQSPSYITRKQAQDNYMLATKSLENVVITHLKTVNELNSLFQAYVESMRKYVHYLWAAEHQGGPTSISLNKYLNTHHIKLDNDAKLVLKQTLALCEEYVHAFESFDYRKQQVTLDFCMQSFDHFLGELSEQVKVIIKHQNIDYTIPTSCYSNRREVEKEHLFYYVIEVIGGEDELWTMKFTKDAMEQLSPINCTLENIKKYIELETKYIVSDEAARETDLETTIAYCMYLAVYSTFAVINHHENVNYSNQVLASIMRYIIVAQVKHPSIMRKMKYIFQWYFNQMGDVADLKKQIDYSKTFGRLKKYCYKSISAYKMVKFLSIRSKMEGCGGTTTFIFNHLEEGQPMCFWKLHFGPGYTKIETIPKQNMAINLFLSEKNISGLQEMGVILMIRLTEAIRSGISVTDFSNLMLVIMCSFVYHMARAQSQQDYEKILKKMLAFLTVVKEEIVEQKAESLALTFSKLFRWVTENIDRTHRNRFWHTPMIRLYQVLMSNQIGQGSMTDYLLMDHRLTGIQLLNDGTFRVLLRFDPIKDKFLEYNIKRKNGSEYLEISQQKGTPEPLTLEQVKFLLESENLSMKDIHTIAILARLMFKDDKWLEAFGWIEKAILRLTNDPSAANNLKRALISPYLTSNDLLTIIDQQNLFCYEGCDLDTLAGLQFQLVNDLSKDSQEGDDSGPRVVVNVENEAEIIEIPTEEVAVVRTVIKRAGNLKENLPPSAAYGMEYNSSEENEDEEEEDEGAYTEQARETNYDYLYSVPGGVFTELDYFDTGLTKSIKIKLYHGDDKFSYIYVEKDPLMRWQSTRFLKDGTILEDLNNETASALLESLRNYIEKNKLEGHELLHVLRSYMTIMKVYINPSKSKTEWQALLNSLKRSGHANLAMNLQKTDPNLLDTAMSSLIRTFLKSGVMLPGSESYECSSGPYQLKFNLDDDSNCILEQAKLNGIPIKPKSEAGYSVGQLLDIYQNILGLEASLIDMPDQEKADNLGECLYTCLLLFYAMRLAGASDAEINEFISKLRKMIINVIGWTEEDADLFMTGLLNIFYDWDTSLKDKKEKIKNYVNSSIVNWIKVFKVLECGSFTALYARVPQNTARIGLYFDSQCKNPVQVGELQNRLSLLMNDFILTDQQSPEYLSKMLMMIVWFGVSLYGNFADSNHAMNTLKDCIVYLQQKLPYKKTALNNIGNCLTNFLQNINDSTFVNLIGNMENLRQQIVKLWNETPYDREVPKPEPPKLDAYDPAKEKMTKVLVHNNIHLGFSSKRIIVYAERKEFGLKNADEINDLIGELAAEYARIPFKNDFMRRHYSSLLVALEMAKLCLRNIERTEELWQAKVNIIQKLYREKMSENCKAKLRQLFFSDYLDALRYFLEIAQEAEQSVPKYSQNTISLVGKGAENAQNLGRIHYANSTRKTELVLGLGDNKYIVICKIGARNENADQIGVDILVSTMFNLLYKIDDSMKIEDLWLILRALVLLAAVVRRDGGDQEGIESVIRLLQRKANMSQGHHKQLLVQAIAKIRQAYAGQILGNDLIAEFRKVNENLFTLRGDGAYKPNNTAGTRTRQVVSGRFAGAGGGGGGGGRARVFGGRFRNGTRGTGSAGGASGRRGALGRRGAPGRSGASGRSGTTGRRGAPVRRVVSGRNRRRVGVKRKMVTVTKSTVRSRGGRVVKAKKTTQSKSTFRRY